jgi:signal transduction histidine kinase/chemotaxis response regulator CheB
VEIPDSTSLSRLEQVPESAFDLIVVGASAGGHMATANLIDGLPKDLPLTVVLMMHLPTDATLWVFERLAYPVEWITAGSRIGGRRLMVAPAHSFVELLPDGCFALSPCPGGAVERPIDRLFESVAGSFGPRAIGAILTGLGRDGSVGVNAMRTAGCRLIVQSPASAEYPQMPEAAIATGAADMVVPLDDIGQVVGEIVRGTPRPRMRSELRAIGRTFGDAGEIAHLAREIDWCLTPLGCVLGWPAELQLTVRTAIDSPQAMSILWGADLIQIYNDRWRVFVGAKHPQALGRPAHETWPELWTDVLGPIAKGVLSHGEAVGGEDFPIMIDRHGFVEEVFVTFSYSPIRDARGRVLGVQNTGWETTRNVVAERRTRALHTLAKALAEASSRREACERAAAALATAPADLPFALIYLFDETGQQASLAGAAGLEAGCAAAPYVLSMNVQDDGNWPVSAALAASRSGVQTSHVVDDLDSRFPGLLAPATAPRRSHGPTRALITPLGTSTRVRPLGVLILGLSPHRPEDEAHAHFIDLVVRQVSAGIGDALANELERERQARLAEIDRTKTEFFANVSHEFRTPLTMMLAPLDELRRQHASLPQEAAENVVVASRNARRLLRLVNSLLDFSAIDLKGRPAVTPINLGRLTADIVSAFSSAIKAAGLDLRVSIDMDMQPVPVNVEMWEKIVSNLISNALKFTFEGHIAVRLKAIRLHAELEVIDTGVGIPASELPNVFTRFHRVPKSRARTVEGAGIGLAIVKDLVQRLGGQVSVRSEEQSGTTFQVWIPLTSRLETIEGADPGGREPALAARLADEAARWLRPNESIADDDLVESTATTGPKRGRVLVVDDNADVRDHLQRLLGARWEVDVAHDGALALAQARRRRPELILADVMMPGTDGIALLHAIREDEALKDTPVMLLTAYAGEDAAINGLKAGADDYVAKPFSARELLARVEGQIELSRSRFHTREINAFLMRFSDAARDLSDADSITRLACGMVGEKLDAEQVEWLSVEPEKDSPVEDGAPATSEFLSLISCEPFASAYERGQSLVVNDTQADPRLSATHRQTLAQTGAGAAIFVPVMAEGRLRALLHVTQRSSCRWMPEMVALAEGVAGRCWAELERARSAAALHLALEHKSVPLTELKRRMRGIMAEIMSINTRTAEGARSVEHYASLMAGRLHALARIENVLADGLDVEVDLHAVVRAEIEALGETKGDFDIDGPRVPLSPTAAVAMTTIVHELVINALDYGALPVDGGTIRIRWALVDRTDVTWLSFEWTEHDGPAPDASPNVRRCGFGTETIERGVADKLDGSGRLEIGPTGARCHIEFPLKETRQRP